MSAPRRPRRRGARRVVPYLTAAGAALVVLVLVLAGGDGGGRTLHLRFADAGQLITGDRVEVGGLPVGEVTALGLTPDGRADVRIRVDDARFVPLRTGTTATIATVGLSGVTNRFVALTPGPRTGAPLADGAVLPESATRPIVDIDLLLDAITPRVRADLRSATRSSARVLHGHVPAARSALRYASPFASRTAELARQLGGDRVALTGLLRSGARLASTLTDRETDLTAGIRHTAQTFAAVDASRRAVTGTLDHAPSALGAGSALLRELRPTLAALDPTLRGLRPAAAPLADVLRGADPALRAARPAVADLQAALPSLRRALAGLPALSRTAVPALGTTTATLRRLQPIFAGLRPYGNDILQALIRGFGGQSAYNYDANGQFGRIALGLPLASVLTSVLGRELTALAPPTLTHQVAKCPGSADRPAPDRSNRAELPTTCDPSQAPG